MIPLHWSTREPIPDLEAIVENLRNHGGSIVAYQRVWSLGIVSVVSEEVRWVPPRTSRFVAGLPHAVFCLLLGWWSFSGFFATISALIRNFMGGLEITPLLQPSTEGQPRSLGQDAVQQLQRAARLQQLVVAGVLFLILAALVAWVALPSMRHAGVIRR
ncbi:MAG: hypothetical protein U0229_08720 [Anaeromyxobacter sp.]